MRLICPNCDAEYQVDDAAIPETGRDVQCSNCGHAWFQLPAEVENARDAEDELFGAPPAAPPTPAVADPPQAPPPPAVADTPEPEVAEEVPVAAQAMPEAADAVPEAVADIPKTVAEMPEAADDAPEIAASIPEAASAPAGMSRPTIAESVLSVLREEAEREAAVRRDEDPAPRPADTFGGIETQTELGLSDAGQPGRAGAAARHIARLKGSDPDPAPETEAKASARRDLLPDIEEINSTLRTETDRVQAEMDEIDALPVIKPRRRGFRSGFVLMIILAVALAMAYIMAPRIIAQIPGSATTMRAYVASVDRGRLWLDGVMKSASGSLRSLSGDGS